MNYLLDTNIVSNLRKARPHPRLLPWLQSLGRTAVFMAAPTLAELQCGVGMVDDRTLAARVQTWIDGLLHEGFPQVVSFDAKAAVLLGRMWTTPSLNNFIANDPRAKKAKSGADLSIAATAISAGMILASANVGDFLEIHAAFPLRGLYNPLADEWAVAGE